MEDIHLANHSCLTRWIENQRADWKTYFWVLVPTTLGISLTFKIKYRLKMNKLVLCGENNAAISMNAIFSLKLDLDAFGVEGC